MSFKMKKDTVYFQNHIETTHDCLFQGKFRRVNNDYIRFNLYRGAPFYLPDQFR